MAESHFEVARGSFERPQRPDWRNAGSDFEFVASVLWIVARRLQHLPERPVVSAVDAGVEQGPWFRFLQGHWHVEGRQLAEASVLGESVVETRFRHGDIDLTETQDEV